MQRALRGCIKRRPGVRKPFRPSKPPRICAESGILRRAGPGADIKRIRSPPNACRHVTLLIPQHQCSVPSQTTSMARHIRLGTIEDAPTIAQNNLDLAWVVYKSMIDSHHVAIICLNTSQCCAGDGGAEAARGGCAAGGASCAERSIKGSLLCGRGAFEFAA